MSDRLALVQRSCSALQESAFLVRALALVLAVGNHMNGGTPRGQADGFDLEILAKLDDVKSRDNSSTLLQFVVQQLVAQHDGDLTCGAPSPFDAAADLSLVREVKLDQLDAELQKLKADYGE